MMLSSFLFVKSNNLRLSYSDSKIDNLGAVPTMDFVIVGFQSLRGLRGPIMHPRAKFWQNPLSAAELF